MSQDWIPAAVQERSSEYRDILQLQPGDILPFDLAGAAMRGSVLIDCPVLASSHSGPGQASWGVIVSVQKDYPGCYARITLQEFNGAGTWLCDSSRLLVLVDDETTPGKMVLRSKT